MQISRDGNRLIGTFFEDTSLCSLSAEYRTEACRSVYVPPLWCSTHGGEYDQAWTGVAAGCEWGDYNGACVQSCRADGGAGGKATGGGADGERMESISKRFQCCLMKPMFL